MKEFPQIKDNFSSAGNGAPHNVRQHGAPASLLRAHFLSKKNHARVLNPGTIVLEKLTPPSSANLDSHGTKNHLSMAVAESPSGSTM